MTLQRNITHHIQKHIIEELTYREFARFRDLRSPKTDTNVFSYHLKCLLATGFVHKSEHGYRLSLAGLRYVDRVSTKKMAVRTQPKIISMLVVQNGNGDILLQKRTKQPFINTWTLPYGNLHIEDASIEAAATRESHEKLSLVDQPVTHIGDAYIRVTMTGELLSSTLAHIFRVTSELEPPNDSIQWMRPHKLANYRLAPAVEAIVARSFFGDDHFFAEYDETWSMEGDA